MVLVVAFARICARARSWREFAKSRFTHFPSFFSVHVDSYELGAPRLREFGDRRGRGMGWATALGARSSGKNTDFS